MDGASKPVDPGPHPGHRKKERDNSRSLFIKGPDGLKIELVWRPDPHTHRASEAH